MRFRLHPTSAPAGEVSDLLAVGHLIDDAMLPGHFFAASELPLSWIAAKAETIAWEIFRGRLVDARQTRGEQSFLSWHVWQNEASEPTISVKLDVRGRLIHVTRGLLCHVHEAFDAGGRVIDSRAATAWTRELVGTIVLADYAVLDEVRDELICLIWQAVVGTSRLPLTSVEAPLPAFVFGQLHYLCGDIESAEPCRRWEAWLIRGLATPCAWRETVKLVEFILRHIEPGDVARFAEIFTAHGGVVAVDRLLRSLFNDLSLSPYTGFVDNALAWIRRAGQDEFLGWLLRQLCRHLTAYDLITFHHRGANYPDALLLDAALKAFLARPIRTRQERRALRQACLARRYYEGHLVPNVPTSPGENTRVLPASYPQVPEEQLTQTNRRQRRLFTDEPLADLLDDSGRRALAESVRDLEHLDERVEMGLGVFIDRPLGYGKAIAEPDLTPLLAHEAFSPSIARRRWRELKDLCRELGITMDAGSTDALFETGPWPAGLPHVEVPDNPRPTAALGDVRKVAGDFVILRTLPPGLRALLSVVDLQAIGRHCHLRFLADGLPRLCVPALARDGRPVVAIFDEDLRRRLELSVDAACGFRSRAGLEWPRAELSVVAAWGDLHSSNDSA